MVKKIIDKWKLNQTLLASKLGITRGTFSNKLQDTTYKFTELEKAHLKKILNDLKKDLEKL